MKKILIIEDDKNIRETLTELLEISGYNTEMASNGKEGFDMIIENKPDLVLCDVNMPELDGFELLGAINQSLKNEIIPVFLFLTAKVSKDDIRHGLNLGADDYILKPFDPASVLDIIKMRLEKRDILLSKKDQSAIKSETSFKFNKIALPSEDGLVLIPFTDIIKCQADRAYCNFHINDGRKILISKAMKEFEEVLLEQNFIKVHKSTIVNINYVSNYISGRGGYLKMLDDSLVTVSVRKKDELMKVLKHK